MITSVADNITFQLSLNPFEHSTRSRADAHAWPSPLISGASHAALARLGTSCRKRSRKDAGTAQRRHNCALQARSVSRRAKPRSPGETSNAAAAFVLPFFHLLLAALYASCPVLPTSAAALAFALRQDRAAPLCVLPVGRCCACLRMNRVLPVGARDGSSSRRCAGAVLRRSEITTVDIVIFHAPAP